MEFEVKPPWEVELLSKVWLQQRHGLEICLRITLAIEKYRGSSIARTIGKVRVINGAWRVVTHKMRPIFILEHSGVSIKLVIRESNSERQDGESITPNIPFCMSVEDFCFIIRRDHYITKSRVPTNY